MDRAVSFERENRFLIAAIVCSALAFLTIQFVFLPFIFGGLSIIFAILSKGGSDKMSGVAVSSIVASILTMLLTICMIAFIVYMLLYNKEYRQLMNDLSMQYYGQSFDEMLEESFEYSE